MVVIILERVQPGVRGELTKWMLELKAGVFVGNVSAMVRDMLWKMVCGKMRGGAGIMVHNAANEQGFAIQLHGSASRVVENFEGLALVRCPKANDKGDLS